MNGFGKLDQTIVQSSWIPSGRTVEVDYGYDCIRCGDTRIVSFEDMSGRVVKRCPECAPYRCVICRDQGIQMDDNGEPVCHCDCVTGEAMLNAAVRS